ncbi:hypothetical protein H0H93_007956 [Arthromyces matolae]|nr:hypothetical protein H0H93_007956 [Arthromyces matolae]
MEIDRLSFYVSTEILKEIIELTHGSVKDNKALKNGHRTRFWCSQDEDRKKKPKQSKNLDARRRENAGMKRYPCRSRLLISCRDDNGDTFVSVILEHHKKHVHYVDVSMPPPALEMIREHMEWLTPVAMVEKVRESYPSVTSKQIYTAWRELSQVFWRRDDLQLPSAKKLLAEFPEEVEVFDITDLPEGVEMVAWSMKKIAAPLKGRIAEIGLDATYNTNSRHLELYSIMAEHDNAGYPLSYCLLSTATAIDQGKRTKALTAWATNLRDTLGLQPSFAHVDKDMAEIGALRRVWNAKISLCWWHLRRAVRTQLGKGKMTTTPYDPMQAAHEFQFIDPKFVPRSKPNFDEYEGGMPDSTSKATYPAPLLTQPSDIPSIRIPPTQTQPTSKIAMAPRPKVDLKKSDVSGGRLVISLTQGPVNKTTTPMPTEDEEESENDDDENKRRTFCPAIYREPIIKMMEKHYCAHPLLPAYSHPSSGGIRKWAVQQVYNFCVEHDLPEVWAYLWGNWYRDGRWELWARSFNDKEIPVLKTTMILESHWRRIKHDFLHHFHLPRCDLLVWILITKLAPSYYRKLAQALVETGRYRELPSWRKGFKKIWRKLEKTSITEPMNDAYRPDNQKWSIHRVPPVFFLEAKRSRTIPIWKHKSLISNGRFEGDGDSDKDGGETGAYGDEDGDKDGDGSGSDEDSDREVVDTRPDDDEEKLTFEEAMRNHIQTISSFARGLEYQLQFRDTRLLEVMEREAASFLRLANACLDKERRTHAEKTWDKSTLIAMYYRARPFNTDK